MKRSLVALAVVVLAVPTPADAQLVNDGGWWSHFYDARYWSGFR